MAIFSIVGIGFVTFILLLSSLVSPKNPTDVKLIPYECGMDPIGEGSGQFTIRYYIFAILFVAFDVEAVFLYPWTLIVRKLGLYGFFEMLMFITVLLIGLLYAWKKGALRWI